MTPPNKASRGEQNLASRGEGEGAYEARVKELAPKLGMARATARADMELVECKFPVCAVHHICTKNCDRNAGVPEAQPQQVRKCLYCERDMIVGSECLSKAQSESCAVRAAYGVKVCPECGPVTKCHGASEAKPCPVGELEALSREVDAMPGAIRPPEPWPRAHGVRVLDEAQLVWQFAITGEGWCECSESNARAYLKHGAPFKVRVLREVEIPADGVRARVPAEAVACAAVTSTGKLHGLRTIDRIEETRIFCQTMGQRMVLLGVLPYGVQASHGGQKNG